MKRIICLALLLLILPNFAFAGKIFGSLKEGVGSVGPGIEVQIKCAGGEQAAKTDDYGAYEIYVEPGRCELRVGYKGQWTPPYPISSSDDPARYDFDLVIENNQYVLKRR
jgi:hypothetical protein